MRPGFVEYLALQNPGVVPAVATLAHQASNDDGAAVTVPAQTLTLPPASRTTVSVNQYLASVSVPTPINISVKVVADVPIVAERPVYFAADPGLGQTVDGGHTVTGYVL